MTSWNAGPPPDAPGPDQQYTYQPSDFPYGGYPGDAANSASPPGPPYLSAPPVQLPQRLTGPGQPASMPNRLVAKLIDGLIVGLPFAIIYVWASRAENTGAETLISIAGALVTFVYETYFIATRGATIGKQVRGILVIDEQTGMRLTPGTAFKRSFVQYIANYVILAGCWSPFLDRPRLRGWHDKAARDVVINSR